MPQFKAWLVASLSTVLQEGSHDKVLGGWVRKWMLNSTSVYQAQTNTKVKKVKKHIPVFLRPSSERL